MAGEKPSMRVSAKAIARYCARDVLVTALVWTRWCALVGDASEERTARREAWIRERLAAGHNISGGRRG